MPDAAVIFSRFLWAFARKIEREPVSAQQISEMMSRAGTAFSHADTKSPAEVAKEASDDPEIQDRIIEFLVALKES